MLHKTSKCQRHNSLISSYKRFYNITRYVQHIKVWTKKIAKWRKFIYFIPFRHVKIFKKILTFGAFFLLKDEPFLQTELFAIFPNLYVFWHVSLLPSFLILFQTNCSNDLAIIHCACLNATCQLYMMYVVLPKPRPKTKRRTHFLNQRLINYIVKVAQYIYHSTTAKYLVNMSRQIV